MIAWIGLCLAVVAFLLVLLAHWRLETQVERWETSESKVDGAAAEAEAARRAALKAQSAAQRAAGEAYQRRTIDKVCGRPGRR